MIGNGPPPVSLLDFRPPLSGPMPDAAFSYEQHGKNAPSPMGNPLFSFPLIGKIDVILPHFVSFSNRNFPKMFVDMKIMEKIDRVFRENRKKIEKQN